MESGSPLNIPRIRHLVGGSIGESKDIRPFIRLRTKEEADLAERQLVKQLFDRSVADTTVTFEDFVEST